MQTDKPNETVSQAELRRFQFNWSNSSPAEARRLGGLLAKFKDDGVSHVAVLFLGGEGGRAVAIFNARLKPIFLQLKDFTTLAGGYDFDHPDGDTTPPQVQALADELLALMERLEEDGPPSPR